jgi:hypothetical protein
MLSIVMTPAEWRPKEVLTVQIGLPIVNVYAGLKRTNPALWYHPTSPSNTSFKTPAIEIANFFGELKQWWAALVLKKKSKNQDERRQAQSGSETEAGRPESA